ncbi:hypothetical protein LguiA_024484 [Lonicera macranthoides]
MTEVGPKNGRGLHPENTDAAQDLAVVCESIPKDFLAPCFSLLKKLLGDRSPGINPLVTYVISDWFMTFIFNAA